MKVLSVVVCTCKKLLKQLKVVWRGFIFAATKMKSNNKLIWHCIKIECVIIDGFKMFYCDFIPCLYLNYYQVVTKQRKWSDKKTYTFSPPTLFFRQLLITKVNRHLFWQRFPSERKNICSSIYYFMNLNQINQYLNRKLKSPLCTVYVETEELPANFLCIIFQPDHPCKLYHPRIIIIVKCL